jgi:hypothetical protein
MRLVIYTSTAKEQLDLEEAFRSSEYRAPTPGSFSEDVKWFNSVDNAVLILSIKSIAVTGWRAPKDTIILFTGSIKDGPEKIQAMMRPRRT